MKIHIKCILISILLAASFTTAAVLLRMPWKHQQANALQEPFSTAARNIIEQAIGVSLPQEAKIVRANLLSSREAVLLVKIEGPRQCTMEWKAQNSATLHEDPEKHVPFMVSNANEIASWFAWTPSSLDAIAKTDSHAIMVFVRSGDTEEIFCWASAEHRDFSPDLYKLFTNGN